MNVVSPARIREFTNTHPDADVPLRAWYRLMQKTDFRDFNHLREFFPSADYTEPFTIFNVGGNRYRVITVIDYRFRFVKIRAVFAHAEYDRWNRKGRPQ